MNKPEVIKDQTQTTTTRWFSKTIDIKTALSLIGGLLGFIIACSFFYWKSEAAWEKQKDDKEEMMSKINGIDEKVTRQYTTNKDNIDKLRQEMKDDREKEFQEIENVADWMHEQDGYWRAMKEMGWPEKFINK